MDVIETYVSQEVYIQLGSTPNCKIISYVQHQEAIKENRKYNRETSSVASGSIISTEYEEHIFVVALRASSEGGDAEFKAFGLLNRISYYTVTMLTISNLSLHTNGTGVINS